MHESVWWFDLGTDLSDKPSAPGQPRIEKMENNAAEICWTAPRNDGGAPITNYRIEMRATGAYQWQQVNPGVKVKDTKFQVTGLREETDYEFRVLAENKGGVSVPSEPSRTAKYSEWFLSLVVFSAKWSTCRHKDQVQMVK